MKSKDSFTRQPELTDRRSRRKALADIALAAAVGASLVGCGSPPKPVISQIQLSISSSPDLNPDIRNRPSPVTVRVYGLKAAATFETADFFSLFEKDTATLGPDIVRREELLLRPGETKALELMLPADVKALAVLVAFRDLERSRWRAVRAVEVGKPANLKVKVAARQVAIE